MRDPQARLFEEKMQSLTKNIRKTFVAATLVASIALFFAATSVPSARAWSTVANTNLVSNIHSSEVTNLHTHAVLHAHAAGAAQAATVLQSASVIQSWSGAALSAQSLTAIQTASMVASQSAVAIQSIQTATLASQQSISSLSMVNMQTGSFTAFQAASTLQSVTMFQSQAVWSLQTVQSLSTQTAVALQAVSSFPSATNLAIAAFYVSQLSTALETSASFFFQAATTLQTAETIQSTVIIDDFTATQISTSFPAAIIAQSQAATAVLLVMPVIVPVRSKLQAGEIGLGGSFCYHRRHKHLSRRKSTCFRLRRSRHSSNPLENRRMTMLLQPLFSILFLPDHWSERPTTVNSVRPDELNLRSNRSRGVRCVRH